MLGDAVEDPLLGKVGAYTIDPTGKATMKIPKPLTMGQRLKKGLLGVFFDYRHPIALTTLNSFV